MKTLVIETATAACSVALIEAGVIVDARHDIVGRGHAERLLPMIAALEAGGRADRIAVDCGPGSFTGIRVGIAAARGLGLGWGVPVTGFSSLAIIAAAGFAADPALASLTVILEGGHGEVFLQSFAPPPLRPLATLLSLVPAAALAVADGQAMIGNGVRHIQAIRPDADVTERLPDARDFRLLPDALATLAPQPIYGRAPDAKPMQAI